MLLLKILPLLLLLLTYLFIIDCKIKAHTYNIKLFSHQQIAWLIYVLFQAVYTK